MFNGDATEYQHAMTDDSRERPKPARLSEVFASLPQEDGGNVTIRQLRDILGDRSLAAFLLFFAAVNLLPLPPGATLVLGLPLLIVSAQMIWGASTAWLPRFILEKSLTQDQYRSMATRLIPRLERLERVVKPRYWPFWPKQGERVVGIIAFVMAISVTLPIPLGNWLPACATALLALALSERDGILLAIGCAVGVLAMIVIALVVGGAGFLAHFIWATSLSG